VCEEHANMLCKYIVLLIEWQNEGLALPCRRPLASIGTWGAVSCRLVCSGLGNLPSLKAEAEQILGQHRKSRRPLWKRERVHEDKEIHPSVLGERPGVASLLVSRPPASFILPRNGAALHPPAGHCSNRHVGPTLYTCFFLPFPSGIMTFFFSFQAEKLQTTPINIFSMFFV
jgi:hypothetical protein